MGQKGACLSFLEAVRVIALFAEALRVIVLFAEAVHTTSCCRNGEREREKEQQIIEQTIFALIYRVLMQKPLVYQPEASCHNASGVFQKQPICRDPKSWLLK